MFSSFEQSKEAVLESIRARKFTEALERLSSAANPRRKQVPLQSLLEAVCTAVRQEYQAHARLTPEFKDFLRGIDELLVAFKQFELRSELYCSLASTSAHAKELETKTLRIVLPMPR